MATIVTASNNVPLDTRYVRLVTFTADASYAAGGYAITPASVGLKTIDIVVPLDGTGYHSRWDSANSKLKFFHGDNGNAAAGPAVEVPNNIAGLSGATVTLLVFGTV